MAEKPDIVFMGTPEFAVPSLKRILEEGYPVRAVVTAPDRPAGRGLAMRKPEVKIFAEEAGLDILQPVSLKDPAFLQELSRISPDIQVVVAFRMLPKEVWTMANMATFNLHASLLPQYRGAAPINWAIIRGEQETGMTTFLIDEKIDTGNILLQEKVAISEAEDAGSLHDRMKVMGAELVIRTIRLIGSGHFTPLPQDESKEWKSAPKLTRETSAIDWNLPAAEIRNLVRGLSPTPGAYTYLRSPEGNDRHVKIFKTQTGEEAHRAGPGTVKSDGESFLAIAAADNFLYIKEMQMEGKKRMSTADFLRGFKIDDRWKAR